MYSKNLVSNSSEKFPHPCFFLALEGSSPIGFMGRKE